MINDHLIRIGDIPPGDLVIHCDMLVVEPVSDKFELLVNVEWGQALNAERYTLEFAISIRPQPSDVDWEKFSTVEPYSLTEAEGDEFVGRQAKLRAVVARLTKQPMTSSYITGQKRIGKSSLALAVRDRMQSQHGNIHFLYLDKGAYRHSDPLGTLRLLGEGLSDFLLKFLPSAFAPPTALTFDGTLAPLVKLANFTIATLKVGTFCVHPG